MDAELGCDDDEAGSSLRLSFGVAPIEDFPELLPEDEAGMGGELWVDNEGTTQVDFLYWANIDAVTFGPPGPNCEGCKGCGQVQQLRIDLRSSPLLEPIMVVATQHTCYIVQLQGLGCPYSSRVQPKSNINEKP